MVKIRRINGFRLNGALKTFGRKSWKAYCVKIDTLTQLMMFPHWEEKRKF